MALIACPRYAIEVELRAPACNQFHFRFRHTRLSAPFDPVFLEATANLQSTGPGRRRIAILEGFCSDNMVKERTGSSQIPRRIVKQCLPFANKFAPRLA